MFCVGWAGGMLVWWHALSLVGMALPGFAALFSPPRRERWHRDKPRQPSGRGVIQGGVRGSWSLCSADERPQHRSEFPNNLTVQMHSAAILVQGEK